jgi:hypothetical protein
MRGDDAPPCRRPELRRHAELQHHYLAVRLQAFMMSKRTAQAVKLCVRHAWSDEDRASPTYLWISTSWRNTESVINESVVNR